MATKLDVDVAFTEMIWAASRAGVNTEHVAMSQGNSTNGIGYRVFVVDPDNGGHGSWPYVEHMGLIGKTRKEAIETLRTIRRVFDGIAYERNN